MNRRMVLGGGAAMVVAGAGAAWSGLRGMGSMDDYESTVAVTRSFLPVNAEQAGLDRYAT